MKRNLLLGLGAILILALSVNAQGLAGSAHDFSSGGSGAQGAENQLCVYCHTPHTTNAKDYLWNKPDPANPTVWNDARHTGATHSMSDGTSACLSCHDGVSSIGEVVNAATPGFNSNTDTTYTITAGGGVNSSGLITGLMSDGAGASFSDGSSASDLSRAHPVGVTYATAQGAATDEYEASPINGIPLYGGTVACGSCHDPHSDVASFLRIANTGSALCISCHTK